MRKTIASNRGGYATPLQSLWHRRTTGWLRAFAWLALALFLPACASTGNAPVTSGSSDPWTAVREIDRGADLQVSVDCALAADQDVCAMRPEGGDSIEVVIGKHVEADGQSLLFRPTWNEASMLRVDRSAVQSIDLLKEDSTFLGTVIGASIGVSVCALSRLLTHEELHPVDRLHFVWLCGLPGAWAGHLIDRARSRDKFTVVRVYQRNVEAPGPARQTPHPSLATS